MAKNQDGADLRISWENSRAAEYNPQATKQASIFVQGPVVAIRWLASPDWPVAYVSPNIRVFGYEPSDFVEGRIRYTDIIHKDDLGRILAEIGEYLAESRPCYEQEYRILCANGDLRWVHDFTTVVRSRDNGILYLDGYVVDTSALRHAQTALAESESRYRRIVETAQEGIWHLDRGFRTTFVNQRMADLLGYTPEEMQNRLVEEFMPEEEWPDHHRKMQSRKQGNPEQYERTLRRKNGALRRFLVSATPVFEDQGSFAGSFAMFSDITNRLEAEKAMREERDRSRLYLELAGVIFIALDCTGCITLLNRRAREILGCDDNALGRNWFETFLPPENRTEVLATFNELMRGNLETAEYAEGPILTSTGERRIIAWHNTLLRGAQGAIQGTLSSGEDITLRIQVQEEQRKLESQMCNMQKLESLAVLAGGIAHDFNNLLVGILGNADLALLDLPPAAPAREYIIEIAGAAKRAADLARQMLAYSGKGRFIVEPVNLNEVIVEMQPLFEISIARKGAIKYHLAEVLPPVDVDLAQLRQVFLNLITNAAEALNTENGLISISTGSMECDRAYLSGGVIQDPLPEGPYVFFEIADSGAGMSRETLDRVFDPFFSTKFTGRGLGLPAVMGIVRGHHGVIRIYSEPGKGTSVKVLLPASAALPRPKNDRRGRRLAGAGTILLVDDEPTVRDVGKRMLERCGFRVVLAQDGFDALRAFQAHQPEIQCVLLDLTMPGMDGEETFRELRRICPHVRVILSSGYNEQDIAQRFSGKGLAGFIQKPYTLETLTTTLEKEIAP